MGIDLTKRLRYIRIATEEINFTKFHIAHDFDQEANFGCIDEFQPMLTFRLKIVGESYYLIHSDCIDQNQLIFKK